MSLAPALEYIQKNKDAFLKSFADLIAVPSVSGRKEFVSDVKKCANVLADILRTAGLSNVKYLNGNYENEPPLVYGEWLGAKDSPTILIYGHYDVVSVDNKLLWKSDPFTATVRDGRVFGRGTSDDKGQILASIKAVESILKTGGRLPVNVKFVFEGEEEVGSFAFQNALERHEVLKEISCDAIFISDGEWYCPEIPTVYSGLRGALAFELNLKGPAKELHSGLYGGAVANPISILTELIGGLWDEKGQITIPGFYDSVVPLSSDDRKEFARLPFDETSYRNEIGVDALYGEKGYSALEQIMGRPCIDIVGIWGGYVGEGKKNAIPTTAGAKISMRLVANQDPKEIEELLRKYLEKNCTKAIKWELKLINSGKPYLVSKDEPLIAPLARVIEATYGKKAALVRCGASIPVVPVLNSSLNTPVIMPNLGSPADNPHADNESFSLDSFYKGIEMYARLFFEIAEVKNKLLSNSGRQKILVIDDDRDILVLWKNILKSLGEAPPVTAMEGKELRNTDIDYGNIKLAIVDFKFEDSEFNGADIIQYLRHKGVANIYLSTAYAKDDEVCRKSRAMGADGVLPKPVEAEKVKELMAKIKRSN